MDDEKLERFKEFMVQQQAQSAERVAQMEDLLVRFAQATRERLALNDQRAQEADRRAQELDEKFAALLDAQIRSEDRAKDNRKQAKESAADFDRRIAALVDAQVRADDRAVEIDRDAKERGADFDRKMAALADAHMRTEEVVKRVGERIDNLMVVVDRHITEGHNGRARPES